MALNLTSRLIATYRADRLDGYKRETDSVGVELFSTHGMGIFRN